MKRAFLVLVLVKLNSSSLGNVSPLKTSAVDSYFCRISSQGEHLVEASMGTQWLKIACLPCEALRELLVLLLLSDGLLRIVGRCGAAPQQLGD